MFRKRSDTITISQLTELMDVIIRAFEVGVKAGKLDIQPWQAVSLTPEDADKIEDEANARAEVEDWRTSSAPITD